MSPTAFRVAFVCTANRFRSPLTEALFRQAARDVPLETTSVGISSRAGKNALPTALVQARRHGVDLGSHRSRRLAGTDLGGFDLVIGFERRHLAVAVTDGGARPSRTFTLPALVELLPDSAKWTIEDPVERARHAVAVASARAASVHLIGGPELEDPAGKPERVAQHVAAEIAELVTRLASVLFGTELPAEPTPPQARRGGILSRYLPRPRK
jgi:protein-tyrosine-phosphatase